MHPLSDAGKSAFTLLETLAALAVSALMIGAILGAQGLVHVGQHRIDVTPLGRLLVRRVAMVFDRYLRTDGGAGQPSGVQPLVRMPLARGAASGPSPAPARYSRVV